MDKINSSDNQITYINLDSSNNNLDYLNQYEFKTNYNNKRKYLTKKNFYLFFLSEFGFITILFLSIHLFRYIPKYHQPKIFTSKNDRAFKSNEEPLIFIHIADLHLSKSRPAKTDGALLFLTTILKYEPSFILMTGDIPDNFRGNYHWHRVGIQNEDDWDIYSKSFKKMISRFPVIDVAGNHDVWGVDSFSSKANIFLDHSFIFNRSSIKNENDFTIKKVSIFNLTFILFNDYRFPVPRPPYGNEPYTNKEQLDLLENAIDEIKSEECFIVTHYNVDRMWFIKSSKGHTFEEIISKKYVYAIFTGHRHPKQVEIIHHGDKGGLEYCTSSCFDKKTSGLITIDNGNLVYHDVYIPLPGEEPKFFLTYPVPNEQISSHHIFNINEFEIRVISFINDTNIILKINGDIEGQLKYKTILKNGALLYIFPVSLKDGNYKIHIYDENNYSCNIIDITICYSMIPQVFKAFAAHKKEFSLSALLIFGVFSASTENFRVRKVIPVELSKIDEKITIESGINDALFVTLPEDLTYINGLELSFKIPEIIATWRDSVAYTLYDNLSPAPDGKNLNYYGERVHLDTLPGKLSLTLHIPISSDFSIKDTPYTTKLPIFKNFKQGFFLRFMMVMKGVPENLEDSILEITAKPVLKNKGSLALNIEFPDSSSSASAVSEHEKKFSVFIDDLPVQNYSNPQSNFTNIF